jgi:hypothetical protein
VAQADVDRELERIHEKLLRGPEKWMHHAADLTRGGDVLSSESDRPISTSDRLGKLGDVIGTGLPAWVFDLAERTLSPQVPYQQSPLSYLDAGGPTWALWPEVNRLEWADGALPSPELDFWFRNVTVGTTALVSIYVTAATTGGTGTLQVRSSAGTTVNFPFTGFTDLTLDVISRPTDPYAVLVSLQPAGGVSYIGFHEVTYTTLQGV